tara:strand:+ start:13898 stop:14110 length:213 start_codon:yes stop_codon:yes gene_type:complete
MTLPWNKTKHVFTVHRLSGEKYVTIHATGVASALKIIRDNFRNGQWSAASFTLRNASEQTLATVYQVAYL